METDTMGRVMTEATIENLNDIWAARQGLIQPAQVRRLAVSNALVDAGATLLSLPTRYIQQLGLTRMYTRQATSTIGVGQTTLYEVVRLPIKGRVCHIDVMEVPDSV